MRSRRLIDVWLAPRKGAEAGALEAKGHFHRPTGRRWVLLPTLGLVAALSASMGWSGPAGASTAWTVTPSPNQGINQANVLRGDSCFEASRCVAVGSFLQGAHNQTLVETLSGGTWTVTPSPDQGINQGNELRGVTCPDATHCVAVGDYFNGTATQTLVETLSRGTWTITTSPNQGTNQFNSLFGVSCSDAAHCVAVGEYNNGTATQTLVETLSGGTWIITPSPNQGINQNNGLSGASCPDPNHCVAVGFYFNGGNDQTLVETLSGGTWTITLSPNLVTNEANALNGVSCSDPARCVAVGNYFNGTAEQTLVENLSGGTWTITQSPNQGTNLVNRLNGVSCSDAAHCVAAGNYFNGTADQTLVETMSGGSWTITQSPNQGTNQTNDLNGVSCSDRVDCTAVGDYFNGAADQTLVLSQLATLGYRLVASDGGVFSFHAPFYGSTGSIKLNQPIVGMASDSVTGGYWMVARDRGIFAFNAPFYGSEGGATLNQPIVGMAFDPVTGGYWMVARDGGIFAFNAPFFGSTGNISLNQPIVGMAASPDGQGYWMVARDGGIFAFGAAGFYGSTGNISLNQPVVGMAPSTHGHGYWLVATDGGVFSFGDAGFFGSTGSIQLNQPIVGMATSPDGQGYWMDASDGGIFAFGDAPFLGSMGGIPLNQPVVGMSTAT